MKIYLTGGFAPLLVAGCGLAQPAEKFGVGAP